MVSQSSKGILRNGSPFSSKYSSPTTKPMKAKSPKKKRSQKKALNQSKEMTSTFGLTDRDFASNYGAQSFYDLDSNVKSRSTRKSPNKNHMK